MDFCTSESDCSSICKLKVGFFSQNLASDSQYYPRPMAANGTRVNVEIEELAIGDSGRIDLPASVDKKVFRQALYIAQNFSTYEGKGTGALLVLSA